MRVALIYLGRRGAGGWISSELALQLRKMFSILTVTSQYLEQTRLWETPQTEKIITPTFRNSAQAFLTLMFPTHISMLVQKIRLYKPNVLLFPMFHPWNTLIQKRMRDIPSVVFVHDPRPHPDPTGWLYGKLEQESIMNATRCIIMSTKLTDELTHRGFPEEQIDIIPLGPFPISLSRKWTPLKKKIPTLLFFGRIVPYKGLDILCEAYADLCQTRQARLVIAGEGNLKPFQNYLTALPNVEVINHWIPETEIESLFSQSDLLVLPYTSASQSGVIPIAASFGLPVIATRTGGITEQIEDGISGWLVQPGDRGALIDAIKDVLDHPDLAYQRGTALHMRYENQFNWREITQHVGESLRKAVQTRDSI